MKLIGLAIQTTSCIVIDVTTKTSNSLQHEQKVSLVAIHHAALRACSTVDVTSEAWCLVIRIDPSNPSTHDVDCYFNAQSLLHGSWYQHICVGIYVPNECSQERVLPYLLVTVMISQVHSTFLLPWHAHKRHPSNQFIFGFSLWQVNTHFQRPKITFSPVCLRRVGWHVIFSNGNGTKYPNSLEQVFNPDLPLLFKCRWCHVLRM